MSKLKVIKPTPRVPPSEDPNYKIRKFGQTDEFETQIYIRSTILKEIVEYSRTNMSRELGGVMVGGYYTHKGRPFIEVEHYIAAKLGESRTASFKFTHESWHEILVAKEKSFPDSPLVGWHHTHPSFGIFLSGMDMFIHTGYFNLPWQVALVVDPVSDKLGFFQWKGTEVVKCGFHTVAPADGKKTGAEMSAS